MLVRLTFISYDKKIIVGSTKYLILELLIIKA